MFYGTALLWYASDIPAIIKAAGTLRKLIPLWMFNAQEILSQ
jgi:hypothetical protein